IADAGSDVCEVRAGEGPRHPTRTGVTPGRRPQLIPSARASSSRPIFERPGRLRCSAISYSSWRVFGDDPPVRLRLATAAPCWPRAVLVRAGRWAIVRFDFAAAAAFLTLRLAACRCRCDAM